MRRSNVLLPVLLAISCFADPTDLASQAGPAPTFSSGRLWRSSDPPGEDRIQLSVGILGDGSRDHRYRGMWIGLGLGALLTLNGVLMCSDPDTGCSISKPLTYGPLMTIVTGVTGAMIGTLFSKDAPE